MKINLTALAFTGLFFAGCSLALAQSSNSGNSVIDVSSKTSIRFKTDEVTQEQMDQANQEYHDHLLQKDPNWDVKRSEFEQQIQDIIASGKINPNPQMVVTLPVVVHVVYNTTAQNISTAQVTSQITVLNQDFGRTNADASQTPAPFAAVAANTGIQFCLAQRDPNGNPTTGIERRQTTVTSFGTNDAVKFYAQGGLDIWDPTRYLNIWVCNLGQSLLGYGEFPTGSPSNTYGVVILHTAFGNTGTVQAPYNLGRTTTHEFSHCFNLYHIWGDDGSACTGTDYCADTPNQGAATTTCYTFPHTDNCTTSGNGIQFMNYMDYSYDNCLNMFSQNQSTRMNAVLSSTPYNALTTSNGCTPVNLQNNDAGILSITTPNGSLCTGTFTPVVVLKNYGGNTLTSCTISYYVDANTPSTYNWTGNLATNTTTNVTLGSLTTTTGAHTFTAKTSNPNSNTDPQTSNDQTTSNFTVLSVGSSLPLVEGFEASTNLPTGWTTFNPDNDATWQISTTVARTGVHSMYMNNCDGDGTGDMTGLKDKAITKSLNFTNMSSGTMTFDVAYCIATYQSQNYTDTLRVYYSINCGQTWNQIYSKGGTTLATAPPYTITQSSACWSPPGPTSSQWRNESINLPVAVNNQANVMFAFENISDWGEQLFIDNVNINAVLTGMSQSGNSNGFEVFPNPASGSFMITGMNHNGSVHFSLFDASGKQVKSGDINTGANDFTETITLNGVAPGMYFVRISDENSFCIKKLVIE